MDRTLLKVLVLNNLVIIRTDTHKPKINVTRKDDTVHDKPQSHDKTHTVQTPNTCFNICSETTTDEKRFLLRQQNGIICIYIFYYVDSHAQTLMR